MFTDFNCLALAVRAQASCCLATQKLQGLGKFHLSSTEPRQSRRRVRKFVDWATAFAVKACLIS